MQTFKIVADGKPYAVKLDEILCDLLAVSLGLDPGSLDTPEAVQDWMQERVNALHDTASVIDSGVEAVCRQDVIMAIADGRLVDEMEVNNERLRTF